jgi:hypothetical protein
MPLSRPFTRTLAGGAVATALALGTLGGAPAQAAQAAQTSPGTTTATYTCTTLLGSFDVPATFSIPGLPNQLEVGKPTGDVPLSGSVVLGGTGLVGTLLNAVYGLLGGTLQTVTSTVLVPVGLGSVGYTLQSLVDTVAKGTTGLTSQINGAIPSFVPTDEGTLTIPLPATITLAMVQKVLIGDPVTTNVPCTLKSGTGGTGTPLSSYTVIRTQTTTPGTGGNGGNGGTTTPGGTTTTLPGGVVTDAAGKALSSLTAAARSTKVRAGKAVRVDVSVAVPGPGTGTVYAYEKGRQVGSATLKGGTASFVMKKVKKGSHTYRFVFQGDDKVGGSEQSVTVKAAKGKARKR